ncbi:phage holin [Lacticaseibacillus sp. N501-2]|uniref:phage holin n=1 Tax=Lacticaseibacillus salsurae TaxID=3367729 RepID=UPI0038B3CB6E
MKLKINWALRLKNKATLTALVAAAFLLVQQILAMFGVTWDYSTLLTQVTGAIGTIFTLLALLGIVVDPTTSAASDSKDALARTTPKKEDAE